MGFADSPTWKWRLLVRLFGIGLMLIPLLASLPYGPSFTALSMSAGFIIIMIS
jgi:hypothetical protein